MITLIPALDVMKADDY